MSFFNRRPDGTASSVATWAALTVVYVVWGSTYLAIRVADETMPPLLTAGARFLIAGAVMYAGVGLKRGFSHLEVGWRQVAAATLTGAALLLGGNGVVMIAERHVPSGLAALLIASEPIWVVVLRLLARERVSKATIASLVVGLGGVAILMLPGGRPEGASIPGILMLVGAAASWAVGSFLSPRVKLPPHPLASSALQMICGGTLVVATGLLAGEGSGLSVGQFSAASAGAVVYLIVAGSLLAFTAYAWLLQNAPISRVSTYAYVNPVIAIFLGWSILSEHITGTMLVGAAVIVVAVAFIVRKETLPSTRKAPQGARAAQESRPLAASQAQAS
jgi:drug/metabolite transporter (DMT)-like permease